MKGSNYDVEPCRFVLGSCWGENSLRLYYDICTKVLIYYPQNPILKTQSPLTVFSFHSFFFFFLLLLDPQKLIIEILIFCYAYTHN